MFKRVIILFFLMFSILGAYDSTIEIVKKIKKKSSIVVVDDKSDNFADKNKLLRLIVGDLKVSTNFVVNDNISSTKGQNSEELELICNFKKNGAGISSLVTLYSNKNHKKLYTKTYNISLSSRFPFLAHNIVVDLNNYLNLPKVDWMKRYIIFSKYTTSGNSDIIIADYTLTFQKTIISGGLNIFPKWANKNQSAFYYTSYNGPKPTLYRVDIHSGSKSRIASSSGMIVCSDVSEDGSKLLLTMAPNDQADIYLFDINSGEKKRITTYRGIDVGGNFVDDGASIVFISNRLGYPNVFSKPIYGGKVSQMVYHGRNNSSCSTFGKYIVYSSRETNNPTPDNTFNIYLISTRTDSIRKLTNSGKNMYPRFGPYGESIIFIKHFRSGSAIGVLRLNANRTFLFPLNIGKVQSIDW